MAYAAQRKSSSLKVMPHEGRTDIELRAAIRPPGGAAEAGFAMIPIMTTSLEERGRAP